MTNKIFGQEIQIFLDYNTPFEHIAFDGVRFGQQFRYKSLDEIGLPEKCCFKIKPIYYSSDTLFQEKYPIETHDNNVFGIISLEEAKLLKKGLQMVKISNNLTSLEIISRLFADNTHSNFAEQMKNLIDQALLYQNQNRESKDLDNHYTSSNQ